MCKSRSHFAAYDLQQRAKEHGLAFRRDIVPASDAHLGAITDSYGKLLYRVVTAFQRYWRPIGAKRRSAPRKIRDGKEQPGHSYAVNQVIDETVIDRNGMSGRHLVGVVEPSLETVELGVDALRDVVESVAGREHALERVRQPRRIVAEMDDLGSDERDLPALVLDLRLDQTTARSSLVLHVVESRARIAHCSIVTRCTAVRTGTNGPEGGHRWVAKSSARSSIGDPCGVRWAARRHASRVRSWSSAVAAPDSATSRSSAASQCW